MTLQENLDSFKGQKMQDKTLFGDLQGLTPSFDRRNHEAFAGGIQKSGAMPITERLPKYVMLMSQITTVAELLKELEQSLTIKK